MRKLHVLSIFRGGTLLTGTIEQALRTMSSASYKKEVFDSLSLSYCSRLMVSEDI